jgi:hypothetical protein
VLAESLAAWLEADILEQQRLLHESPELRSDQAAALLDPVGRPGPQRHQRPVRPGADGPCARRPGRAGPRPAEVDPAVVAAVVSLARAVFVDVDDPAAARAAMATADQVAQVVLLAWAAGGGGPGAGQGHGPARARHRGGRGVRAAGSGAGQPGGAGAAAGRARRPGARGWEPVTAASLVAAEGLRRFAGSSPRSTTRPGRSNGAGCGRCGTSCARRRPGCWTRRLRPGARWPAGRRRPRRVEPVLAEIRRRETAVVSARFAPGGSALARHARDLAHLSPARRAARQAALGRAAGPAARGRDRGQRPARATTPGGWAGCGSWPVSSARSWPLSLSGAARAAAGGGAGSGEGWACFGLKHALM